MAHDESSRFDLSLPKFIVSRVLLSTWWLPGKYDSNDWTTLPQSLFDCRM